MTLKQEFRMANMVDNGSTILEKYQAIADEFAIGFTEWFADNTLRVDLDGYKTFGDTDETEPHTIKELLEIYKKEKGL